MALVTPAQLQEYLENPEAWDAARAQSVLDIAEAEVQGALGREIEEAEHTETYGGNGSDVLILRHHPVTAIGSLALAGGALTDGEDFTWRSSGVVEKIAGIWGTTRASIEVTYTAGFAPGALPHDIRGVVLRLAARLLTNPTEEASEALGDHRADHTLGFSELDQRVLARYRARTRAG